MILPKFHGRDECKIDVMLGGWTSNQKHLNKRKKRKYLTDCYPGAYTKPTPSSAKSSLLYKTRATLQASISEKTKWKEIIPELSLG